MLHIKVLCKKILILISNQRRLLDLLLLITTFQIKEIKLQSISNSLSLKEQILNKVYDQIFLRTIWSIKMQIHLLHLPNWTSLPWEGSQLTIQMTRIMWLPINLSTRQLMEVCKEASTSMLITPWTFHLMYSQTLAKAIQART